MRLSLSHPEPTPPSTSSRTHLHTMSTPHTLIPNPDPTGKSSLLSSPGAAPLPVIEETRPTTNLVVEDCDSPKQNSISESQTLRQHSTPGSCRTEKKGLKGRIRGLRAKYESCLQAIDGAGDVRGCSSALAVPACDEPFERQKIDEKLG